MPPKIFPLTPISRYVLLNAMNTRFAAIAGTLLVGLSLFVTSIVTNNINNNSLTTSSEAQTVPADVPACTDNNAMKRYIRSAIGEDTMNTCGQRRFYYCEDNSKHSKQLICSDGRLMPRDPSGQCQCRTIDEWVNRYKQFCCSGATATTMPPTSAPTSSTPPPGDPITPPVTTPPVGEACTKAQPGFFCEKDSDCCQTGKPGESVVCLGFFGKSKTCTKLELIPPGNLIPLPTKAAPTLSPTAIPRPTDYLRSGSKCLKRCSADSDCSPNGSPKYTCKDISLRDRDCSDLRSNCRCVIDDNYKECNLDESDTLKLTDCLCLDRNFCKDDSKRVGCSSAQSCPDTYACKPLPGIGMIPGNPPVDCSVNPEECCRRSPASCFCYNNTYCPKAPKPYDNSLTREGVIQTNFPSIYKFIKDTLGFFPNSSDGLQ